MKAAREHRCRCRTGPSPCSTRRADGAYRRSGLFERRWTLMQHWAEYIGAEKFIAKKQANLLPPGGAATGCLHCYALDSPIDGPVGLFGAFADTRSRRIGALVSTLLCGVTLVNFGDDAQALPLVQQIKPSSRSIRSISRRVGIRAALSPIGC